MLINEYDIGSDPIEDGFGVIYGAYDPLDLIKRHAARTQYIGSAENWEQRKDGHIYAAKTKPILSVDKWIRGMIDEDGRLPGFYFLETVPWDILRAKEWKQIELGFLRGWPLLNDRGKKKYRRFVL